MTRTGKKTFLIAQTTLLQNHKEASHSKAAVKRHGLLLVSLKNACVERIKKNKLKISTSYATF
jgi:hypothetical protein